jgi:hypothetical protein
MVVKLFAAQGPHSKKKLTPAQLVPLARRIAKKIMDDPPSPA